MINIVRVLFLKRSPLVSVAVDCYYNFFSIQFNVVELNVLVHFYYCYSFKFLLCNCECKCKVAAVFVIYLSMRCTHRHITSVNVT